MVAINEDEDENYRWNGTVDCRLLTFDEDEDENKN